MTDSRAAATPAVSPTLARALARWQHAAGPYWPYVAATPFSGDVSEAWVREVVLAELTRRRPTGVEEGDDALTLTLSQRERGLTREIMLESGTVLRRRPLPCKGRGKAERPLPESGTVPARQAPPPFVGEGVGGGGSLSPITDSILDLAGGDRAAIFVDVPPARALPAAVELNRLGFVVVPVIPRWVTASAVLDCRALIARLVIDGERCRRLARDRGVVFVLDGDRAGPPGYGLGPRVPRRFDNRYAYSPDRFPSSAFLRAQDIVAARWLAPAGPAPDLQPYRDDLARELPPDTRHLTPDTYDAAPRR